MMCFRDQQFCGNDRHAPDCPRPWTSELSAAAERWWGGPAAPVAFGLMCDPDKETKA
jgi:hypothetical protein